MRRRRRGKEVTSVLFARPTKNDNISKIAEGIGFESEPRLLYSFAHLAKLIH